ncbi:MAG: glutamate racemase [Tepidisphaeraceae bacterium]
MANVQDPIFVLDSGLGGLTVVRALLNRLPGERIIYIGDTARLPYGTKTRQTVSTFVEQIIAWGGSFKPKHVVIACNTASALALSDMRQIFAPLPISGVVEPGAYAAAIAASTAEQPSIGVIATEATIRSGAYQAALSIRHKTARLRLRATPLLVPLIEEGRSIDDPIVDLALRQYLAPMIEKGIDVLVLGCTHYPLLKRAVRRIVGKSVAVIDSAEQCAEDVAAKLEASGLSAAPVSLADRDRVSAHVTDDPARFEQLARRFLGFDIERPTLIAPETLYQVIDRQPPAAAGPLRLHA